MKTSGIALLGILFVTVLASGADNVDLSRRLQSNDRTVRLAALREVQALKSLPKTMIVPIIAFARREMQAATEEQNQPLLEEVERIPLTGEETPLVKVKAKPRDYLDQNIVVCGAVTIGDYWNVGYDNAETTHFSLRCEELNADAQSRGESVHLYLSRKLGQSLVDRIAAIADKNRGGPTLLRLKVTLLADRYGGAGDWDLLELNDWQFLGPDGKTWSPWVLEGILGASTALEHADKSSLQQLINIVIDEKEHGSELVDGVGRILAIQTLVGIMNERDRQRAFASLKRTYRKLKSDTAKRWAVRLANAFGGNISVEGHGDIVEPE